ncbi:MAG: HXXEE domain-containing protein [Ginsengibacter sp.]
MNTLRKHWYDLGGILASIVIIYVMIAFRKLTEYELLMWLSLASLFFHQLEEYRVVGTFPGMINTVIFKSNLPDRYPLNTNSSLIINVTIGWLLYFSAAYLGEKTIWLGLAVIMVSLGNFIAHTFLFNIKGKTLFNAGMITSWIFFAPCIYFFIYVVYTQDLIKTSDYLIGIPIGLAFNFIGIFKMIDWLKDKNTTYIFGQRNLLPKDRNRYQ